MRYVVLHHVGVDRPHFDLMIETDAVADLTTLRCPRWPLSAGDVCEELPDHRRVYLDYEGPISGGRGSVSRVEAGTAVLADLSIDPQTFGLTLARDGDRRELTFVHGFADDDHRPLWHVMAVGPGGA